MSQVRAYLARLGRLDLRKSLPFRRAALYFRNPLRIGVGARHGVPLRVFFHSFLRRGQPARRLVLLREFQRIRFAIFGGTALARRCGTPYRRSVRVVTEFAGHGDDASTEEKRAASEHGLVRWRAANPFSVNQQRCREEKFGVRESRASASKFQPA